MLPIGRLPEFANLYAKTTARIYYSTDATLDPAGDIQLAQFPVSALAASAIQVNPVKLSVPGVTFNTSGATVYVQLDLIAVVQEISEINNQEDNDVFFIPARSATTLYISREPCRGVGQSRHAEGGATFSNNGLAGRGPACSGRIRC